MGGRMTPVFRGSVHEGKLRLDDRSSFDEWASSLNGKQVTLTLKQWRATRSGNQNRYYWGAVLKEFGDYTGHHTEELHEALKLRFLAIDPEAELVVARSTTELNTQEFAEYVDRVIQLAAEMGCPISNPDTVEEMV